MEKKVNLIIFHYHFIRGGVKSAIRGSLNALKTTDNLKKFSITLLCGKKEGVDSLLNSLDFPASVVIDPRLDYSDYTWPDEKTFRKESSNLASFIFEAGKGYPTIYWIHNPTLGKNPLVTAAWYESARIAFEKKLPYGFLYHIHDFAECGRIENLIKLKTCWGSGGIKDFYPTFPNVAYGVLNSGDKARLLKTGISSNKVFWLPNVVSTGNQSRSCKDDKKQTIFSAIEHYAKSNNYTFFNGAKNWLMPVRVIRRKNVLEGILLALMHSNPRNVLITLDATSSQEIKYADTVKRIVKKLEFPAVIGFGDYLVGKAFSFSDLLCACDASVTTSVLEGFGFAFLEGLLQEIPITGRNIPFITNDFVPLGFPSDALYDELLIPVDMKTRNRLMNSGRALLDKISKFIPISAEAKEHFITRLEDVYGAELVDFAALDLEAQIEVCKKCQDVCLLNDIAEMNNLPKSPAKADEKFFSMVDSTLGPEAHSNRLLKAFSGAFSESSGDFTADSEVSNISVKTMEQFLDPLYFRPLLGGWP